MEKLLPSNRKDCIEAISNAFAECPRPSTEALASWGGQDGAYVVAHWSGINRGEITAMDKFGYDLSEDLSYMSSPSIRYFLPSIMILALLSPKAFDSIGGLISRLEGIFGCRSQSAKNYDKLQTYRPVAFTEEQCKAIFEWCGLIMTLIKSFYLDNPPAEYRNRLKRLRKAIRSREHIVDYDAERFL